MAMFNCFIIIIIRIWFRLFYKKNEIVLILILFISLIDFTIPWIKNNAKFPVMMIETVLVENFINLTKKCLTLLTNEE